MEVRVRYFDHDTTAASDDLIMALRLEHGGAAVDCYWAVIEQIYRDEQPAPIAEHRPETKALSVRLAIAYQVLETYVKTMISYGLLRVVENDEEGCLYVTSDRAEDNIKAYREKCEKARLNGAKGGRKSSRKANANRTAKRTLTTSGGESQAKKRKEKKGVGHLLGVQTPDSECGAEAGEPAPPSAPECPVHHSPMRSTGISGCEWWCDACMDGYSEEAVA